MQTDWIRESNLIEDVDDSKEDRRSERAWGWLINQEMLALPVILELHKKIMRVKLAGGRRAGHWRDCQVYIGGHESPPWDGVPGLMVAWLHNWTVAKPYLKAEDWIKEAHIDFEHIHPFIDGNGRTGRMILNFQRVKAGLEPLCIKASERGDYYEWFMK